MFHGPELKEPLLECLASAARNAQDEYANQFKIKDGKQSRKLLRLLAANFVHHGINATVFTDLLSVMKRSDPRYSEALIELFLRLSGVDQLTAKENELAPQQLVNEAEESAKDKANKSTRVELSRLVSIANALRLLWDGKQAVLFRDSFYPKKISKVYKEALNAMAKRKAAKLGVLLVSLDGGGVAHGQPLRALGGSAPFDYSDGSGGLHIGGKYMIVGARYL